MLDSGLASTDPSTTMLESVEITDSSAAAVDAGVVEAGVVEAGVVEAGVIEACVVEAGVVDAVVGDVVAVDVRRSRFSSKFDSGRICASSSTLLGLRAGVWQMKW